MSFFFNSVKNTQTKKSAPKIHIPIHTMNEMGCKACALDKGVGLQHPKMPAHGDSDPDVFVVSGMPTEFDDQTGRVLSGKDYTTIKDAAPNDLKLKFQAVIRCHDSNNNFPTLAATECCRGYLVKDIEDARPAVIVGVGKVPLLWATGLTNIDNWRGKPVVVKVGSHTCWYYPVYDPEFVQKKSAQNYGKSEFALIFEHDWEQIAALVKNGKHPKVYTGDFDKGIVAITGNDGRNDLRRLQDALNHIIKMPQSGIDLETNSKFRPYEKDSKIITCAVGSFESTVAFALDHPDGWSTMLRKEVWGLFIDYLLQSNKKIAHNLSFELEWLCYCIDSKLAHCTEWADTMMLAHTLDERKGVNSLDDLCRQHFGFFLKSKSKVDVKRIMEFSLTDILIYNGMDTKWTDKLYTTLHPIVYSNKKLVREYERKLRLEPTLVLTQLKGVDVDFEYAAEIDKELQTNVKALATKIENTDEVKKYRQQFGTFSPTSPEHVLKLMKDICKRPEVLKSDGGTTSDEAALSIIPAHEVPSAPLILEHRATSKLLSTYLTPIMDRRIVMPDGKMHTRYNSMVAETGRLSSDDPNLQNFPKRKHKRVRGVVTAGDGWFFPADYGQLEARVIAWCSEDEALMRALWTGYDIHGFWTDRLLRDYPHIKDRIIADYEIDLSGDVEKATRKSLREEMKNGWVFPQFFGASIKSCASNLKIPEAIAEDMGADFWGEFQGVQKWQEKIMKYYDKHLYIETLGGRQRRGAMTKNQIINFPIQGTAADLVTDAMCEVTEYAAIHEDEDMQPRLNIHDDLTFLMPDYEDKDFLWSKIDRIMQIMCRHRFNYINVPVVVELSCGRNWYEQEALGIYRSNEMFNIKNPYQ